MPAIPAVCDSCGAFFSSGIYVENVKSLQLRGNKAGPCPRCGGMVSIPDGDFSVVGQVITLLSGPEVTYEAIQRLNRVLQDAATSKNVGRMADELAAVPNIGQALLKLFPENKADWGKFIERLLQILTFLYVFSQNPPLDEEQTSRAVQRGIEAAIEQQLAPKSEDQGRIGRNQPCPCKSGKKYKHCCGALDLSPADRLLRDFQRARQYQNDGNKGDRT